MATLLELTGLTNDPGLKDKVQGALMVVAMEVVEEDPQPANHAARLAYAQQVMTDPQGQATKWVRVLLGKNSTATVAQINGVNDSTVLNQVRNAWDLFTG